MLCYVMLCYVMLGYVMLSFVECSGISTSSGTATANVILPVVSLSLTGPRSDDVVSISFSVKSAYKETEIKRFCVI